MSDYDTRLAIYKRIERQRHSKVLLYVTGDRRGMETRISSEVIDLFVHHLDIIGPTERISLILHTTGGDIAAAWRLINLLRTFCDFLEVLIPLKAHSAGTLISLGANRVIMTKQATLGPIDPSTNGPLNPQIPGGNPTSTAAVSVEAVRGYLDTAHEIGITESADLARVLTHLSDKIHPLVLGQVFRTRTQIRELARKLLPYQVKTQPKIQQIVDFLCSESGSHDYTINRREGSDLGLNIVKPSTTFYQQLRNLHNSYTEELQLLEPFNLLSLIGQEKSVPYSVKRCLIESVGGGSHGFISEGTTFKAQMVGPQGPIEGLQDNRSFEGWRKII